MIYEDDFETNIVGNLARLLFNISYFVEKNSGNASMIWIVNNSSQNIVMYSVHALGTASSAHIMP